MSPSTPRPTPRDFEQARAFRRIPIESDWESRMACASSAGDLRRTRQQRFINEYCKHCDVIASCIRTTIEDPQLPSGAAGGLPQNIVRRLHQAVQEMPDQ